MRISDWSSDVCSSDLLQFLVGADDVAAVNVLDHLPVLQPLAAEAGEGRRNVEILGERLAHPVAPGLKVAPLGGAGGASLADRAVARAAAAPAPGPPAPSDKRGGGKECVPTCRCRGA